MQCLSSSGKVEKREGHYWAECGTKDRYTELSKVVKFLIKNRNITGEIINIDSGQRLAWNTPDIINVKE